MILVTGGAGFIGSAVVWELNKRGIEDIVISDHLGDSTEKWKNLRALKYAYYIEKDDLLRPYLYNNIPGQISAVVHLGACSSTTETDSTYLFRNNCLYSQTLLEHFIKFFGSGDSLRIPFIYASSAATYGDGRFGFSDDIHALEELRPLNMYGYSKQMFDLYAKRKGYLNRITGIKFFNVYGPNEYHKGEMSSKIFKAFHEIKATGKIKLFKSADPKWKDGESVRDFVYVKDCARIICDLIEKKTADPYSKELNGIFNLGSGKARSWNDLARSVFHSLNMPVKIEYIEMPEELKGKYQYFTESENSRLIKTGAVKDFTGLEQGITDYIKNYLLKDKFLGD
jgi:ADP-L-glycero-D-manno-heptose 6-epimerase